MALGATVKLLNTIPDVVLCGNRVPLKFEASTNLILSAGSKAEIILTWSAVAVADEYFDLLLFKETVRFTCKAAPDNSGIQFHDNTLGGSLIQWVALLAGDLEKNYLIAKYYDVVVDDEAITLTAKEEGVDYTQEFTAGAGIDCAPTETNKAGTDKTYEDFYGIALLLYCNDELVTELILNVDEEGLAEVDIADLLRAYIEQDFEWPESISDFIFARAGAIVSWYFKFGERWGDGEYSALQESDTYYALYGGVSWKQLAKYNADVSSFWAKLQANKYFLSWAPLTRYIGPAEPVKLFYLNYSAATTLTLRARLYKAGGFMNLINSLVNIGYETFIASGVEISSAIASGAVGTTGSAAAVNTFNITAGERIYVSCFLTLNSGWAPFLVLMNTDGSGLRSDMITLTAGQNDFFLTATQNEANAKLFIFNNNGVAANFLIPELKIYRDPDITVDSISDAVDKTVYEMVLSPDKVEYDGLTDESLLKIEVWILNEVLEIISEVRTFIFDYNHYEHTRYFIFKNSLGAFEVIRSVGLMVRNEDYNRETAAEIIDSDYTSKDREELSVANRAQQKFTVSLGWLNRFANADEFRNWLRDFTMSKEVYQVSGDTLIPIRLTGNNFDKGKDRDNLAGFTFEYVNAFTDEFFTKELTPNLLDESFNTDFEEAQ